VVALVNKAIRDRLGIRSAQLAFWTALSVVPVLMLAFAMTGPLGLTDDAREAVRQFLYQTVLAASVDELGDVLDALLAATSLRTLGIAGVVGLMVAGAQVFFTVERTYNELYGCRIRRSTLLRFLVFYAAITLGPLFVGWGLINMSGLGAQGSLARAFSVIVTAGVLCGAIWLLPDTEVRPSAALIGGLFSSVVFELAKEGFSLYIELFGGRSAFGLAFGSVAFIPFSLLWIQLVWSGVLLGVELAYVIQHRSWQVTARKAASSGEDARQRWPDGMFAVTLMTLLSDRFDRGAGPSDPNELSVLLGVEPTSVQTTLDVLEDAGLVLATKGGTFTPTRPSDQVRGTDVLRLWRGAAGLGRSGDDPLVRALAARLDTAEAALDVPLAELASRAHAD
jgi:membrane protein